MAERENGAEEAQIRRLEMIAHQQPFAAHVTAGDNDAGEAVVVLIGEINSEADAALNAAYSEAERGGPSRVTLDFSRVSYINSTGIALIVGILARARAAHRPLAAVGLSDHYREIFSITRLSDFIEIK